MSGRKSEQKSNFTFTARGQGPATERPSLPARDDLAATGSSFHQAKNDIKSIKETLMGKFGGMAENLIDQEIL